MIRWCVLPGPISDSPKRSRWLLTTTGGHTSCCCPTIRPRRSAGSEPSLSTWFSAATRTTRSPGSDTVLDQQTKNYTSPGSDTVLDQQTKNYTFTWLRYGSRPTNEELDDILQQIRALTRGLTLALQMQFSFSSVTRIFMVAVRLSVTLKYHLHNTIQNSTL